jgi:hypothetical protein
MYVNTLQNQYALDDAIVITQNQHVKKGIRGISDILSTDTFQGFFGQQKDLVAGGRYRPLSLVMFAVEYQFFGMNPKIGHLVNIILYALVVVLLLLVLRNLVPNPNRQWMMVAWFTAFLFAIHPIHTEAVANIKGRDEILTLLFALLAWKSTLNWIKSKNIKHLLASGLFLFLGAMSKEHAVAFVFVIPFSLWFFGHADARKTMISATPLFVGALIFVVIRHNVLGTITLNEGNELMNNPFADATTGQRFATILFTVLWYLKLLVWPHPLTFDYYPYHVELIEPLSILSLFSLAILLILIVLAIAGLKKRFWATFWIVFFFATFILMSNLVFTVGTFMNERFMFIPSLSFAFGIAWIAVWAMEKNRKMAYVGIGAIIVLSGFKTITRNRHWHDDATLFTNDVKISVNSAKSNTVMGGKLFEEAQRTADTTKQRSILIDANKYLSRALEIHPNYNDARLLKGNVVFQLQSPESAMEWYLQIFQNAPKHAHAWKNALIAAGNISDIERKLNMYKALYVIDSNRFEVVHNLGLIYSRNKNDYGKGTPFLEKAVKLNTNNKDAIRDLGITYGMSMQYEKSEKLLTEATKRFPNDGQLFYNLAITLFNLKKTAEAQAAFDKASQLDPNIKPVKLNP